MKILSNGALDQLWDAYWRATAIEWFKLEVLQDYTRVDDGPSLRAWLQGDQKSSLEHLKEDDDPIFTQECQAKTDKGVKLTRVHVISEPLSAYMQWEIEYYKRISVPLRHENVFLVKEREAKHLNMPSGDLIIFDDVRAIQNIYDQNGHVECAKIYDKNDDIGHFISLKNDIIKLAHLLTN